MTAGIAYVEGRWEFILFRARAFDDRSGIDVRGSLSLSVFALSIFSRGFDDVDDDGFRAAAVAFVDEIGMEMMEVRGERAFCRY